MCKMETNKYRVEIFITPQVNITKKEASLSEAKKDTFINELQLQIIEEVPEHNFENKENVEDMIKESMKKLMEDTSEEETTEDITEKMMKELPPTPLECFQNVNSSTSNSSSINFDANIEKDEVCENLKYPVENIYDEPFVGNLNSKKMQNTLNSRAHCLRYKQRYFPRPPKRTSSLKSIDESMEILEQTFQDICYHGHKNGCTVAAQQPEEVSQEVFKENWLQKLEALRQREALLRDKELALQSQERLLFKKERQLRILERLVKDKMRQAELYLKRCKQFPGFDHLPDVERSSESGISHSSKGSKGLKTESAKEIKDNDEVKSTVSHIYDEIKMKNPPNSRSSLVTTSIEEAKLQTVLGLQTARPTKFSMHNSLRLKQKSKVSYDDLDSTLSADVGDSSFGITATKFNPEVFKKPIAFQRSVSERKPTFSIAKPTVNVHINPDHGFKETKILKKFSENIMVSQNKDTKFLHYGLIDNGKNVNTNDTIRPKSADDIELVNQKKQFSCLDKDGKGTNVKSLKRSKERPTSWNAENDDWLQKKRQQYNMSMRKVRVMNNKENQLVQTKTEKEEIKPAKKEKKEGKTRKFMIFR